VGEIYIVPVRAELRAGALSQTITLTNRRAERMRVAVKLVEWTQDADGSDVYKDTTELVYFPRLFELPPDEKRLVRVGASAPGGAVERAYRLFFEEQPEAAKESERGKVSVYFRMGVPVFVAPANPQRRAEVGEPTLDKGKLSLQVRNPGNQHVRVLRVLVEDGAGFSKEIPGWYSLAGSQRTYSVDLPREVCRQGRTLSVTVEGDGVSAERKLHVDPARCV
jgi:fimbrial chaperone protein